MSDDPRRRCDDDVKWAVHRLGDMVAVTLLGTIVLRIRAVGVSAYTLGLAIPHPIMDAAWVAWLAIKDSTDG